MTISRRDTDRIKNLVREGKQIARIVEEDFPQYDYWDVYSEVYGSGEKSAQGVKWIITNRLNQLTSVSAEERQGIVDEVSELVWYLYENYKASQRKLDSIRKALGA